MAKERLDILVQRQAAVSRSKAQGMIRTGCVTIEDGTVLDKPGMRLDPETRLVIAEGPRFVSRGGDKLEGAFEAFPLDVCGRICIDAGASTGGFTDCLLQHGAAKVYAVDVGYGQLAWKLRQNDRVVVMERCNIRYLTPDMLPDKPAFFTVDCSFISLELVLPPLAAVLEENAEGVVLIKPQFEAGRHQIGKGGVVRDPSVHDQVIASIRDLAANLGFDDISIAPSPLIGPAGNREFLAWLRRN
jgi:23S rRNA (cytidine1920-2'-O)/16S rRNA (cytidine1409-2'-O)-methyltransferase